MAHRIASVLARKVLTVMAIALILLVLPWVTPSVGGYVVICLQVGFAVCFLEAAVSAASLLYRLKVDDQSLVDADSALSLCIDVVLAFSFLAAYFFLHQDVLSLIVVPH